MTVRNPLQCNECGNKLLTRTAIGHGDYQEFAFPCPKCGVEIRFGMNLDQENAGWQFTTLINAKWIESEKNILNEIKLDGENLKPINDNDSIMPFLKTAHLPKNVFHYMDEQGKRFNLVGNIWPIVEKLIHFFGEKNRKLFNKSLKELGIETKANTREDEVKSLIHVFDVYGGMFRMRQGDEKVVRQRINLGDSTSSSEVNKFITALRNENKVHALFNEIFSIRKRWSEFYNFLFPLFNVFYWDSSKHKIEDYTLCQKRFEDVKQFYVDCFETLCRFSCLAAAFEGLIQLRKFKIPKRTGVMDYSNYVLMNNGAKPDILKNLSPIDSVFIPYIDSKLRNGLGHHSARYQVKTDTIEYVNHNKSGITHHSIPYIKFCEKIVHTYIQIEITSLYFNWALARVNNISSKIV